MNPRWRACGILTGGVLGTWLMAGNRVRRGVISAACVSLVTRALVLVDRCVTYPTVGRLFGRGYGWRRCIRVGSGRVARDV